MRSAAAAARWFSAWRSSDSVTKLGTIAACATSGSSARYRGYGTSALSGVAGEPVLLREIDDQQRASTSR